METFYLDDQWFLDSALIFFLKAINSILYRTLRWWHKWAFFCSTQLIRTDPFTSRPKATKRILCVAEKGASIYDVWSGWGGRGSPKSRQKEQNLLICDSDKGGGGKQNFADVFYGSHLTELVWGGGGVIHSLSKKEMGQTQKQIMDVSPD